jgi:hypothetical protein
VRIFTEEPGVRVLWCLRRKRSDVRCVLLSGTLPVEVHVLQDTDFVLRELFPEERAALDWARAYHDRLVEQGWRECPEGCTPSSAA